MQHTDVKPASGERESGDKSPRSKALLLCAVVLLMGAGQAPGEEPDADPSDEIRRTKPDFVLYDPTGGKPPAWSDPDFFWLNEHVLVQPNGRGELLAMWTAERLKPFKWRVMYAHSKDGGTTWTAAKLLDGPRASWQVPIVAPKTGRVTLRFPDSPSIRIATQLGAKPVSNSKARRGPRSRPISVWPISNILGSTSRQI